jgi:hypothetical protein
MGGVSNAKIKSWAAAVAAAANDVRGNGTWVGIQSKVFAMRSLPVSRTYTL